MPHLSQLSIKTKLLRMTATAIISEAILCFVCYSDCMKRERTKMLSGMKICNKAINKYKGSTFEGQKRKKAYNMSKVLK